MYTDTLLQLEAKNSKIIEFEKNIELLKKNQNQEYIGRYFKILY